MSQHVLARPGLRVLWVATIFLVVGLMAASTGARSASPSAPPVVLEPVTESGFGITSVAPVGWRSVGPGLHTRSATPGDATLLAIQAAPVKAADLWTSLLAQLHLDAIPEPSGTREAPTGTPWTLYHVDSAPTGLSVDIALAEAGSGTWLVVLQAATRESPALHDTVFLPAVDAFALVTASASPLGSTGPLPYADLEVSFPGGADDVVLAGTLSVPTNASGPFPAIVLVTGSGPQDRDESVAPVAGIKPFAIIADALARAGVAVLRFDDRGTAHSTGDYQAATVEDFTADAAAAVRYLRTRPEVDPTRLGLLGHSEGGLDVAEIAAMDPAIAFVVGMAPPATSGLDLLVQQNEAILRVSGVSGTELDLGETFARDLFDRALAGDKPGAEQVIRDYAGGLWDRQPGDVQQRLGDRAKYIQSEVDARMTTIFSPWFVSLLASDAGAAWARVHAPVLGLFGGKDVQVPAEHQAPAMQAALDRAGDTDVTIITLPDANHLFQSARTGAFGEYGSLEQRFTPDFLPTLVAWVTKHADPGR